MPHRESENYLKSADKKLKVIIEQVGPCTLRVAKRDKFDVLASSIISQQLSVKAARTIKGRIIELVGQKKALKAESLKNINVSQLRSCGLSNAKASYILSLAENTINGSLNLKSLHNHTDEEIVELLIRQKGVGKCAGKT